MEARQILIADNDVVFREGLQMVLSEYGDEVLTSGSGPEAVALAEALAPDVVLIDPDARGLDSARRIKMQRPQTHLILLSVYDRYLAAAVDAGADGYLLKGGPVEELLAAIRRPDKPVE
jgi:DNA-binding NarL/FixJ family response regulator